jgi:hypothetical protein
MGCCSKQPAEPAAADAGRQGRKEIFATQRSCRDVCFLLLFILFWVGWIIVLSFVATTGCSKGPEYCNSYKRLLYGFDEHGVSCATGANDGKEFLYYPDPTNSSFRRCLTACPGPSFGPTEVVFSTDLVRPRSLCRNLIEC